MLIFWSFIHAPLTLLIVLAALAMPFSMASSKLEGEVDEISMFFATDIFLILLEFTAFNRWQ
jgi:low temperature requirement protein LtrA